MEINLAQQVTALWYQCTATTRTWAWANPDVAPTAEITNDATATAFKFQDGTWDDTLGLPFLGQPGFDAIEIDLVVAADNTSAAFAVRAKSQTLITAVSTVTTPYTPATSLRGTPPKGAWSLGENYNKWSMSPVHILLESPDIDSADPIVALAFDAMWDPIHDDPSTLTVTRNVKLFSVMARSVLQDTTD